MVKAKEYRERAREAAMAAQKTNDPGTRKTYEGLELAWKSLARTAERTELRSFDCTEGVKSSV